MGLEFVLHLHSGKGPAGTQAHYDLMLQEGDVLATWQFEADPAALEAGKNMPCRRIQDHRTFYLSYQGPLTNNRGQVTMRDYGQYEQVRQDDDRRVVRLSGRRLAGLYELCRVGEPYGPVGVPAREKLRKENLSVGKHAHPTDHELAGAEAGAEAGVNDWLLLCVERG